ncbi:MAG: DUF4097 family beta strand repeat protein [Marinilabiliaceae bacterium]|nr:DUF4097 family beta strand repeat protein [Marinilabiliaceae bacterium]
MKKVVLRWTSILQVFSIAVLFSCSTIAQEPVDSVEETFTNVTAIEVEGSFCAVEVLGTTGSDVEFKGEVLASKKYDIKIRHNVNGNTLRVWLDRPNSIRGTVKGKLAFKVPANTDVTVENSSGSVRVEEIGQSNVKLTASSGSVQARNIASDLTARASSGSLIIEGISGDLRAETSSGSQRISDVKGNVKTKVSSGSLKVNGVGGNADLASTSGSQSIAKIGGNLWTKSSSGSLKISEVTGDLSGRSTSGSISLDRVTGAIELSSSSGSQKGTNIKLTGPSSFKASSGSVSMQLFNEKDELSFNLTASSGSLSAKGSSGRKNLVIERGPIKVSGNTSSGSQTYR